MSSGAAGTTSTLTVRAARFLPAGGSTASLGLETGYRHVGNIGDLDAVRVSGHAALHRSLGSRSAFPFLGLWGGLQYERVGSFGQTRFPVGTGAGVLSRLGTRAALRVEYRFARVVDRKSVINRITKTMSVVLQADAGAPARFGPVTITRRQGEPRRRSRGTTCDSTDEK